MSEGKKSGRFEKKDWTVARRYVNWAAWIGTIYWLRCFPCVSTNLQQATGSAAVSVELLFVSTSTICSSSTHVHMCNISQASAELRISKIKEVELQISGEMES